MQDRQTLLMVAAGFRPELLATPKEMGFHVALLDSKPPVDTTLYDDFINASPVDEKASLAAVEEYVRSGHGINAVGCFFDGSTHVAAAICERFGLPGNSRQAVRNMRDKFCTWRVLSAAGLPVPRTAVAASIEEAAAAGDRIGYPLVMKPQSSAASQGVIKVSTPEELRSSFKLIDEMFDLIDFGEGTDVVPNIGQLLYYPDAKQVLLQEYVDGFEVCVDVIYDNDSYKILGILDKPQVWPEPYFPELIFVTPSHLPEQTQQEIEDLCARSLRAVGAATGAAHIEFRLTPSGPRIIEVNGRIGGPSLFVQEVIELATGDWGPRAYLTVVSGGWPGNVSQAVGCHAGFASLPVEGRGRILRFEGEAETRALAGVVDIKWPLRPGHFVPEGFPRNPNVMYAHVLATGSTYREVVETLDRARQTLRVVMDQQPKHIPC